MVSSLLLRFHPMGCSSFVSSMKKLSVWGFRPCDQSSAPNQPPTTDHKPHTQPLAEQFSRLFSLSIFIRVSLFSLELNNNIFEEQAPCNSKKSLRLKKSQIIKTVLGLNKLLDALTCFFWSLRLKKKKLDNEWPENLFHHVGSLSASSLLSVQCEVSNRVS